MNRIGLGVCVVGNWDDLPPSWEQLRVTARTLRWAMAILMMPFHRTFIKPHSFYNPDKSCPGKRFPMDELYRLLEV